jgi:phosphohistidine phosphatase
MKTLFVLRHAKSSWDDSALADFDRPLNDRGKSTAPFMGAVMAERGFAPDIIVASPAVRARETARLAKEGGRLAAPITHDERIYEASPQTLKQVVASTDDDYTSVMIVGHNPGMEGFIRLLTGRMEAMPTAALAVIDLDIESWRDIANGGTLRQLIRPKDEKRSGARGS